MDSVNGLIEPFITSCTPFHHPRNGISLCVYAHMLFCYTSTPHQGTRELPFFLFGSHPRLPIDFLLGWAALVPSPLYSLSTATFNEQYGGLFSALIHLFSAVVDRAPALLAAVQYSVLNSGVSSIWHYFATDSELE